MFATLTLRRTVPVSLPTWGAIGGFTMAVGFGASVVALLSVTRAPRVKAKTAVSQVAFDVLIRDAHTIPLDEPLAGASNALTAGRVAAVVHSRETAITLFDANTGKKLATLGDSAVGRGSQLAIAPADFGRWIVLDRANSTIDLVTPAGARVRHTALPRGAWSNVAWDSVRRRLVVTGWALDAAKTASDGRSIHEFDEHGVEVAAYREIAPVTHRLQASFNMPFASIDGSIVLSGTSLSNEIVVFDRASAQEHVVRVADDWFTPINWELPRQGAPAKSVAEPVMNWLASQTMLTGVIPLTHGRFIARFTLHAKDRDRYAYALVDSTGSTRALTRTTTVNLSRAAGDTVSGFDVSADGRTTIFVGVVSRLGAP